MCLLATPCGILIPQPGTEPLSSALKACSLNHWTARQVSVPVFLQFVFSVLFCFLFLFLFFLYKLVSEKTKWDIFKGFKNFKCRWEKYFLPYFCFGVKGKHSCRKTAFKNPLREPIIARWMSGRDKFLCGTQEHCRKLHFNLP